MTNPNANPNDRVRKQELSAANASGLPAGEDSAASAREQAGPVGSAHDLKRDDANTDTLTGAAASGAAPRKDDLPDTASNPKQGAAPAYQAADVRMRDFSQVAPGWSVVSADGEDLGTVARVGPNWIAVPYGTANERTMYVPVTYLETIANRRVVLNQPAGLLIDMKLNQPPADLAVDRERLGGTKHQPWRADSGDSQPIAEPNALPVQKVLPPQAGSVDGAPRGGANRHPEGSAFDSQVSTIGRPLAPDEPFIASRSIPSVEGGPGGHSAPDLPPGSVSRPDPATDR